jgi:hypothetical protein
MKQIHTIPLAVGLFVPYFFNARIDDDLRAARARLVSGIHRAAPNRYPLPSSESYGVCLSMNCPGAGITLAG